MNLNGLTIALVAAGALVLSANSEADQDGWKGHNPKVSKHQRRDCDCWRPDDWRARDRNDDRYCSDDRYRYDDRWREDDRWRQDDRWRRDDRWREYDRREQTKQEWRNIGNAAGFLSFLGMLDNDRTLTFAGQAGALYAAYRYDEDCRSQDRMARARAHYFSQPCFFRDGKRYERRTVIVRGVKHYQFVCDR